MIPNDLQQFLISYEQATNSHDFSNVAPLLLPEAVYFFSEQTLVGINAIRQAFIDTWNTVKEEVYSIHDVHWVYVGEQGAACRYRFHWKGMVEGVESEGAGRGTNIIVKRDGKWHMAHEHLSVMAEYEDFFKQV